MKTGTVKWFNDEKGFGFIAQDGGGKDCFVHFKDIVGTGKGRKTLVEGAKVTFDEQQSEKGLRAVNVSAVLTDGERYHG